MKLLEAWISQAMRQNFVGFGTCELVFIRPEFLELFRNLHEASFLLQVGWEYGH
jgi:hypothetical protein